MRSRHSCHHLAPADHVIARAGFFSVSSRQRSIVPTSRDTTSSTARVLHDGLRNLYSVLKGADEHLKFAFLSGVLSKFRLFSGMNDITLDFRNSALCGYTDADVDPVQWI